jgi:PAS domain S-box-containing protein
MNDEYPRPREPIDRPMFWEPSLRFLKYAIACLLAGSSAYLIGIFIFAPDQTVRAVEPIWIFLTTATAWVLLSRGRIETAFFVLAFGTWTAVTGLSIFFGGVRSTSVILYPPIIMTVGWLLGARSAAAVTLLTVAATFGFVLAESWGLLPLPAAAPPVLYWVVQSGAFIFSAIVIVFLARSYQGRLKEADKLGSDLAQRITEIKAAEQALRISEARFRNLTELSSDWYWEQDAQFRFTNMAGQLFEKTGIRIEDHLGKTRWDMPAANLSQADWAEHRALLERHQPFYGFEMQRPDPGGRPHWVSISGQPLFDDAGRFAGYCGVGSDITERKLAQLVLANMNAALDARVKSRTAELEQANEALQHSNMELQRFVYVASHDLKTPLRSIASFAQLLEKSMSGKLDAQADDWMRRIAANAQSMHRMLGDLRAYAQLDSAARPFERVELSDACRAALGWLRDSVQSSGAQISCGALPAVLGDTLQLTQLFQNLIGNALMYCGEAAPKIEISARDEDDHHIISVSDRGLGIEAGHQQRIFDMFYRLQTRQAYPGTGIGLAVCQRIVHRHRGRIWVESEPGKGSTFRFTLPMLENSRDSPV